MVRLIATAVLLSAVYAYSQCVVTAPTEGNINLTEITGQVHCPNDGGCTVTGDSVANGYQPVERSVINRLAACRATCAAIIASIKLDVGRGDGGLP